MASSDPSLRRLARQLVDVDQRLKNLETVPQLAHSSLDDHGMPVYDADGNLAVTVGKQSDGTYSARPVAGPTPPAPVGLNAEGDAGLIHASWQGVFWAGAAMPRDFEAVEVLVDGNVQGAIHDPDGGSVTVSAFAGEREVSFRTLSQAGRRSDATGHVTVTVHSKASVQLDEARGRIEDAEGTLAENGSRLTAAERAVQDVRDELAAIEVGEGGPLIHSAPPGPADGEGKPAGTAWLVYGTDGALTSVWQWDGTAWEEMPLDAALIPVLDIGSGTFGDLEGARLVVDGTLSARVAQAMSAEVKELVVTESAVLNHVTAIGQTVVDDINVQGKLVGKDGVFTGTVDFENVNVTGELLANEISGEHIYGTVVEGGEIRTTAGNARGAFTIGDTAYVSPMDGYATPGIQFTPPDSGVPGSAMIYPPGVGVDAGGIQFSGGRNESNARSDFLMKPGGVMARAYPPDSDPLGWNSSLTIGSDRLHLLTGPQSNTNGAEVYVKGPVFLRGEELTPPVVRIEAARNGRSAKVQAFNGAATVESSDGTTRRSLQVDGSGVWVKKWRNDGSGQTDTFNLLGDDWGAVTLSPAWAPRATGGYFKGLRVRRLGGSLEINGAVQGGPSGSRIGTIVDPSLRPTYDTFVVTTLASGGLGQAFVGSNGDIMHSYGPNAPAFLAINVSIPLN